MWYLVCCVAARRAASRRVASRRIVKWRALRLLRCGVWLVLCGDVVRSAPTRRVALRYVCRELARCDVLRRGVARRDSMVVRRCGDVVATRGFVLRGVAARRVAGWRGVLCRVVLCFCC